MTYSKSPVLVTIDQINRYWTGKPLTEGARPFWVDWGEPECFACGFCPLEGIGPSKTRDGKPPTSGLERAHVIPSCLGGSDSDPSNFAVLCKQCHTEAPDTNNPNIFWRWVSDRERTGALSWLFGHGVADLKRYTGPGRNIVRGVMELGPAEIAGLQYLLKSGRLESAMDAAVKSLDPAMHWGEGFSQATVASIARETLRH